jgi:hypothetical protein
MNTVIPTDAEYLKWLLALSTKTTIFGECTNFLAGTGIYWKKKGRMAFKNAWGLGHGAQKTAFLTALFTPCHRPKIVSLSILGFKPISDR